MSFFISKVSLHYNSKEVEDGPSLATSSTSLLGGVKSAESGSSEVVLSAASP